MGMIVDYYVDQLNKINKKLNSYKSKKNLSILTQEISELHPADISDIFNNIDIFFMMHIFSQLSSHIKADTFIELSKEKRQTIFIKSTSTEREVLLHYLTINELVDFFDDFSDEDLNTYIRLLNKSERKKLLSLLEFPESSAAGIMESEVIVLPENIVISKTLSLLKKMKSDKTLYKTIFIVNKRHELIGYVLLEDLFFADEKKNISSIMRDIEESVKAHDDQEQVGIYMTRYRLGIVPVTDENNHFLGVITSEIIARAIESEASEDIFRMASLAPIQNSYFETKLTKLIWQRASILSVLLLLQSISTMIIGKYAAFLTGFLITCVGMVTSTGGNMSSQVSALVIQGLASGEMRTRDKFRFLKREIVISLFLGLILSCIGALRVYIFNYQIKETIIIGVALFSIVFFSTILGSSVPFILHKVNLDPAHSAGPLLATCMDIFGVIIFTTVIYGITNLFFN